jgi:2-methylfumaryl-CoA hydratase
MSKHNPGNFFEDFRLGQTIRHATPRTVTAGDQAVYTALYGSRFALQSSDDFARACGLPAAPVDDLLAFHVVFGKTVPDISLNAVANLGYADARFLAPVFPGDTLSAESEVVGLKENSNGKTGVVYVRSRGTNQRGEAVIEYTRWVMVRKGDAGAPAPEPVLPKLPEAVPADRLHLPEGLDFSRFDSAAAGSAYRWGDYAVGEKIDHGDAMTIEEAEHQMATRLYQNTARVHFNQHRREPGPIRPAHRLRRPRHLAGARAVVQRPRRNAVKIAAINGGTHAAPELRRRHHLCLVGSARAHGGPGPQRPRRPAPAQRGGEGSRLYGLPLSGDVGGGPRRLPPGRGAGPRLHGAVAAVGGG